MMYTRKGDTGTTTLYRSVDRFSKASPVTEALGALDELNSYLGLCKVLASEYERSIIYRQSKKIALLKTLHTTQETLFIIQAEVAGAKKKVSTAKITSLEKVTDSIEQVITPLHTFTISGGTVLSAHLDIARTLARKVERRVVALHEENIKAVHTNTLAYLNRLSSLLFALARYTNHLEHVQEQSPTYS